MAKKVDNKLTKDDLEQLLQNMAEAKMDSKEQSKLMVKALKIILQHIDAKLENGKEFEEFVGKLGAGSSMLGKIRGEITYWGAKEALYWILRDLIRDVQKDLE